MCSCILEHMFVRVALVLVVALTAWALFVRDSGASGPEHRYRVEPGDTLWSIAAASYAGDPREGVWKLRERNDLAGTVIVPGQVIVVPS
jgi:LysM domain